MLFQFLKTLWNYLRESAGENDYEHYRVRSLSRGETPAKPGAFYIDSLERKYSHPNRCC